MARKEPAGCPKCGDSNVFERHTVYIEPKKRSWAATKREICQNLDMQEMSETTFAVECLTCGASWRTFEDYKKVTQ